MVRKAFVSQIILRPNDDEVEFTCKANYPSLVPYPKCLLRASQGGISVDKIATRVFSQAILDKGSHTPYGGRPSLKVDFETLYAIILQRSVDISLLENKVEGFIKQAYNLKALSQIAASEHLLQETKREVVVLKGQIDIINATKVMDSTTKAS
ncbi:hypothetical protein Cgig2_008651 [Carnegiea gigantea]|uniref:Uncharacterized protein n=1 Tax=Carnegiea gigantea TaxID=171969 RepID=A0A9Q1JM92_9CARY|nr:hypothetical protein Cgig2_008651 [Carnegiea gigantea]